MRREFKRRPEQEQTVRGHLVRLMTSHLTPLNSIVVDFLFVLCKENGKPSFTALLRGSRCGEFLCKDWSAAAVNTKHGFAMGAGAYTGTQNCFCSSLLAIILARSVAADAPHWVRQRCGSVCTEGDPGHAAGPLQRPRLLIRLGPVLGFGRRGGRH